MWTASDSCQRCPPLARSAPLPRLESFELVFYESHSSFSPPSSSSILLTDHRKHCVMANSNPGWSPEIAYISPNVTIRLSLHHCLLNRLSRRISIQSQRHVISPRDLIALLPELLQQFFKHANHLKPQTAFVQLCPARLQNLHISRRNPSAVSSGRSFYTHTVCAISCRCAFYGGVWPGLE